MIEKILVVDMINGFVKSGALHDERILNIVPKIKHIVERKNQSEIIVIEDHHTLQSTEFDVFPVHCLKDDKESETIEELQYLFNLPNFRARIAKNSTNAFFALDEAGELDGDVYYIVGCRSDICILHLALTLKTYSNEINRPIRVVVIKDAIETYDSPDHNAAKANEAAVTILMTAGVEVMTLKELLKEESK